MTIISRQTKKGEIIYKTEGFYYEIEGFSHEILHKFLNSNDGIYGLELLISEDYSEIYAFTPNTDRLPCKSVDRSWGYLKEEMNSCSFYEVELKTYPFLPLYTVNTTNLLSELQNIPLPNTTLFTQILISRAHNWQDTIISQYEDYLNGNDYPSSNKLIRTMQSKALSLFGRLSDFQFRRDPINACEDKVLSQNFNMEIRFILIDANEEVQKRFESGLVSLLKKSDYYNELQLIKVKDKQKLFQCMMNKEHRLNQLLSSTEIQSLLIDRVENNHLNNVSSKSLIKNKAKCSNQTIDALSIFPGGDTKQKQIDETVVNNLTDSFKRNRITNKSIKVNSVNRGSTLQKVSLTIPGDIVYTNIEKNLKNIQASLGNDGLSMEIGDMADTVDFYIPCKDREVVYLKDLLQSGKFNEYVNSSQLPLVLGEDSIGNPLFSDLTELKHILIGGATGSGKSVYLNSLILTLLIYRNPNELQMILIDPKKVELNHFEEFPHVTFVDDMEESKDTFKSLIDEMEKRYELFASKGNKNIKQYNGKSKVKLPYTVCVVDELSDLMDTHGSNIEDSIVRLCQKARAAGIHLILCTQKPSADVVTSRIKSNLPSAISFRLKAQSDYRTVFGKGIPYHLLGNGDGIAMIEGHEKEFIRFQAPVITLDMDEEHEIYDSVKDLHGESETFEVVEQEKPIDKLKRIIAETGDTKVTDLQKHMQMRINVVNDLIKQLVEEEWLVKDGRSYRLIVAEEEMDKWRSH